MTDTPILDASVASAPKSYVVAGAQEIILKGVTASFNGSGAAGSYVPAVQIIDPGGNVVGTYTLGSTLAAGASADVSWFPGVTNSASLNPVVSNQLDYVEITASVTILPANTSANQKVIITGNPIVFDGLTRVRIEAYSPVFDVEGSNNLLVDLWDNATDTGRFSQLDLDPNPVDLGVPYYSVLYYTPTAGTHTFSLRGWTTGGGGSASFGAGAGGTTAGNPNYRPAWLRVST